MGLRRPERVDIVGYDPAWPEAADRYAAEVEPIFHDSLVHFLEHIGSTAVPGLAAKPVIDLMVSVEHLDVVTPQRRDDLRRVGWAHVPPHRDGRPWRWFFVRVDAQGGHRLAHLHVMARGEPRWDQQIHFRDQLRADQQLREEYEELKFGLRQGLDREAYSEAKAAFIRRALGQP